MDVVAPFPSTASELSVLWFKSKIESVPGLVVTTRPISIMEGKKTKQCYAFQITATYQGYTKKAHQSWFYGILYILILACPAELLNEREFTESLYSL